MSNNYKQKHAKVQEILNAAEKGGGGGGGTSDYTDLTNKPSINSVTLSGNKTTYDLGISPVPEVNSSEDGKFLKADYDPEKQKGNYYWDTINQVPTIGQGDTGKLLKANFNSGNPIAEWATPAAPAFEYADWANVHLSYVGSNYDITGTYQVEYNGFATIVFNTDYREIAQSLTAYSSFQGLEADLMITLTRDQQDYPIIDTTLYFPNDNYASSSMNFITTNSNVSLALPVMAGDEISISISSSNLDQTVGGTIETHSKLECFVQKYV